MKKFYSTIVLLFSGLIALQAAPPTVPASNLQFPIANIEGNRFTTTFNKGNGGFRIIVVKEGSAINSLPVNGTEYTANTAFGAPGTAFATGDGYVVYRGSSSNATVSQIITNLQPGTTYYVSIFEYNGSGSSTDYLAVPLSGNVTTKSAPTGQAAITTFTAVAGNKMTVNWSIGNGDRRLLIARKGSPVNAIPQNLSDYTSSTVFGNGNVINGDNFVVYKGQSTSAIITNLEPNTTYHFAIFEYNGNNNPVYLSPGAIGSRLTSAGPTQASGNISYSNVEGNRLTLSFSPGNGKHQLIIARQGQAPTAVPVNGQTYTASTVFGSGQQLAPGEFVMNTVNADRTFTNLLPSTVYYFRIYDFDVDAAGNTYYLTSAYSQNSNSTALPPSSQASNVRFENITGSSLTIKHDAGTGTYRLIVMKQGTAVDATPANLVRYVGNQAFGSGQQITTGNYVLTDGQNSTSLPVTGLTPGITYHVAVFGFNGNNYPIYATPAATASITMPNQPTAAGTAWQTNNHQGNSLRAQWTGGDGSRRLVIARKGAPVSVTPTDGVTYTASNIFGNGSEISTGQFVVYDDVNRVIDLNGLEIGSVYHFAVFEYNISGGNPDYLTSSFLVGTGSTASSPTEQVNGLFASSIQNTQALINFSVGNGNGRLFIMRAGSPVNVSPEDLASYSYSPTYGGLEIGTGNYIVQKSSGSTAFNVLGLSPNTQYYVSAFEYNGTSAPVFMRPGASFSFTTTGSGVTPPASNASSPSFSIIDGNKLTFAWEDGDGARRMVVARQGSAVSFNPVNATDYTANASFGNGTDYGGGHYIVYNGTGSSVPVTNLLPGTVYHFAVFEYNGTGASASYLIAGALTSTQSTATTPATGSTGVAATVSNHQLNITWNSGPGSGRIVVLKEGSAIINLPADLSKYPANSQFGSGSQIGAGEYVVYAGNGNSVTVTGLSGSKTYHYTVFEYNGVDAPIYNTTNAASNSTTMPVALPLTWTHFTATENSNGVILKWGTSDELNTSYFIIERNTGNGFDSIGTVHAIGLGNGEYSFTDHIQPAGTVSYRIRQVDIDKRYTYSKQVVVKPIRQQAWLKLYPNPSTGHTRISLPQGLQQATVKIYNMEGRLVKTISVVNGEMVGLTELKAGIYHVVLNEHASKLVIR